MSNQATAVIIADSSSERNKRITTFQLRYWRPIHSELMTHRVFSRNAGSSRARPSQTIINQVRDQPWGPIHWGKNEPGMQANAELEGKELAEAKHLWGMAAVNAANIAQMMVERNVHKQIVNRVLEPFTYIDVVLTATDFNNWWALRDHPDAQPEIQELARLMKAAFNESKSKYVACGDWHLPYIQEEDWDLAVKHLQINRITRDMPSKLEVINLLRKISTARCARVSYKAFDGTTDFNKDVELFDRLLSSKPLHASPAEHQATPDKKSLTIVDECEEWVWNNPQFHGNFNGWCQHRKMLPDEFIPG